MKPLLAEYAQNIISKLSILALFLTASITGNAQARHQADVSITSINLSVARPVKATTEDRNPREKSVPTPPNLVCDITVHSYWDDNAKEAKLLVLLPVEVYIVSMPANATLYDAGVPSSFAGYLIFNLGEMNVGQSITVSFTFTKSAYANKVGAYAYSGTADPNPVNNYKDAVYSGK